MNIQTFLVTAFITLTGLYFQKEGFFGREGKGRRVLVKLGVRPIAANLTAEKLRESRGWE